MSRARRGSHPLIHLGAHDFAGIRTSLPSIPWPGEPHPGGDGIVLRNGAESRLACTDVKSFGDRPVLVIASSDPRQPEGSETPRDVAVWTAGQRRYFAELARKSTHGTGPVIVPHSTHGSMTVGPAGLQTAALVLSFAQQHGLLR